MSKNTKLNRLGKVIVESGCGSLKDFIKDNNLKVNYATLYGWITKKTSINEYKSTLFVDEIADVLNTNRVDVLNMIATDPIYDVELVRKQNEPSKVKSELQLMRERSGLSAKEVAILVGDCDAQFIYDIENGKTRNFHTSTQLKNYMELFGIGMGEMVRMQDEACKRYSDANGEYKKNLRKERGLPVAESRVPINKLQEFRLNKGLTVIQLAEKIGFPKAQMLTDIEHGRRRFFPSAESKCKYMEITGITEEELDSLMEEIYEKRKKEGKYVESKSTYVNEMVDKIYNGYDEEVMEKRDKAMEEFDKEYEVTHMDNEAIITPREEKKCLLPAEDMQRVMSILYGKVDFDTFKTIENILGGEQ